MHFPAEGITDEQLDDNEQDHWVTQVVPEVFTTNVQGKKLITEGYTEED